MKCSHSRLGDDETAMVMTAAQMLPVYLRAAFLCEMEATLQECELEPGMADRAIVAAQHKLFDPPQSFSGGDWCDGTPPPGGGGYL
jgi:hypothetical protein